MSPCGTPPTFSGTYTAMRSNPFNVLDDAVLFGFLFTFARIGAVLAFMPLPGMRATPAPAKIILCLVITAALWPVWAARPTHSDMNIPKLVSGLAAEISLGLAIGVVVSVVLEIFQFAAQLVSLQAGFAYASTIDPMSGADSPVLVTSAQLLAAVLFFCSGTDRIFFRVLAESLVFSPPGAARIPPGSGDAIIHLGNTIFVSGLRLAAPVMVLLLLADILLAVFGRLQPALQLTQLTFPVKLAASMLLLAPLVRFYPRFFLDAVNQGMGIIERLLSGGHTG